MSGPDIFPRNRSMPKLLTNRLAEHVDKESSKELGRDCCSPTNNSLLSSFDMTGHSWLRGGGGAMRASGPDLRHLVLHHHRQIHP